MAPLTFLEACLSAKARKLASSASATESSGRCTYTDATCCHVYITHKHARAHTHTDAGVQTDTRNLLRSAGECTEVQKPQVPCTLHPTPSHTHILHGDGCEGGHGGGGGPGGQRGLTGDQRTKINALNLAGDRIVKYLSHFSDIRGGVAAEGFQLPQRTLKSPRLARVLLLSMHAHAHARHVPASHARGYKHHIQASHAHVPCKHHKHVVLVRRARASRSSLTCTPSAPAQLHTPRILGAH